MVNFNKTILLRGITNKTIRSIGETVICLNNEIPITFQVVDSDFPIKQGGILGTKFFANNKGIINYETNTLRFGDYSIPFHMQYLDEEDKLNTFEARTQDNVRRETAYSDIQNRTQDNVRREIAYKDEQNRTQDNVRREIAYKDEQNRTQDNVRREIAHKDEQNRTQDNVRREIAYKDEQNRTQDNVRREIAYKDEQNRTQDNVRREIAYKDEQNRTQDNVRREIAYKDEQNRTQDNVRREIPCKDEQYRTQDNVRREITCELEEQIATYKEQEYRVSAELNEGRAEPSQQIDKQKENSRPSAGASRRGIELLCDQLKECNAYLRASREIHKAGKGRDNERMPGGTEKINKSNNNELADKKEKPSTKETECIEKKERYDEETTCEDNSSQTDAAIHCIEGNIRDNDVRGDATPRSEEPASDEYNYGKPRLPSDEEWNKYYEIFGKSLNSYEADYDDINDVCEYTDSHDKIKAEQSECEFIGHLDEYGDEHLEDFYGKLNITQSTDPNSRVSRWQFKLSQYEYEIRYKPGRTNVVADCLSRNPTTEDINVVTRARTTKTARPNYKVTRKYVKKRKKPEMETTAEGQKQNDDIDETTVQSTTEAPEIVPIPQKQEQADEGEETTVQSPEEAPEQPEEDAMDRHRINYEEDFEKCDNEIVIEKILIECREKLFMRKDNYAFFIDCDGRATDEGASQLLSQNKLKTVKSDPGEVTVIKRKQTVEFAICIKKHNDSTPCIIDNIEKGLLVLKALIEQLGINTISIAKSQEISHVPWDRVENMLKALFVNVEAKIIICNGEIKFVPLQERQQVLRDMHASAIGGHKGISKTVRRMRPLYYWKSMKSDIIKFIQRCDTCQLKKLVRKKVRQPMVISDTPYDAMQKVAIDIVGPLPRTKKGNNNILTIQCNLTKFCRAIALQDATAETVADAFLKEFICIFSCPQIILSDQGTNFTSKVFVNLAKAFKIKTVTTTSYRPSSNGSLERSHHSLAEYLKTVAGKNKEWDDLLEMAMFSYNTSVHEAHQFQPFQLVFGKLPTLPTEESIEKSGKIVTYTDYERKLCKTLSEIKAIAREKLIDAKLKNKFYYDKKTNAESFKPGDYVYLLKGGKQHKLGDQYTGPYLVLEVNNDNNNVKIEIKNKHKIIHANRLKKSHVKTHNN
uniref:RNA-directed DNA polymerase n=1 Tax=Trichogramma kaykai TaxID=54128 RepID=A0ABD2W970_9HYME